MGANAWWREALAVLETAIPSPEEVLERLSAPALNSVRDAAATSLRMLQPLPVRPRLSPSSLVVARLASQGGCLYYSNGLRAELRPTAGTDHRWKTEYLQHHPVIRAAGPVDSNLETHDLIHVLLGLLWWPGISQSDFYIASRLSEAVAGYHYYFLDQVLEPRCRQHEAIVDLGRIWKFHSCARCNKPENLALALSERRRNIARMIGLECARQGEAFLRHELEEIGRDLAAGVGFIRRNPVNFADNAGDAFRYAHYVHPFLSNPRMEPYVAILGSDQVCGSVEQYLLRATRVVQAMTAVSDSPLISPGHVAAGRLRTVIQDVLLRLGTVLVQHDGGARPLPPRTIAILEEVIEQARALGQAGGSQDRSGAETQIVAEGVVQLFIRLGAEERDGESETLLRDIATTGYDLDLALGGGLSVQLGRAASGPDLTHIEERLLSVLAGSLPRTAAYLRRQGLAAPVAAAFRVSPERWSPPELAEVDGRFPWFDVLIQRLFRVIASLAAEGDRHETPSLAVALELGRVELDYLRYQVTSAPHLDLRDGPVNAGSDALWVRLAPTAVWLPSWVDIAAPDGVGRGGDGVDAEQLPHVYVFSLAEGRTHLTRLGSEGHHLYRELSEARPWDIAASRLAGLLAVSVDDAERMLGKCSQLGMVELFTPSSAPTRVPVHA